jgi:succinate dehydrogenase/fumarate reductase cytochrome b subunit
MWMGHFSGLADVLAGNREEVVLYEVVKQRLAQGFFVLVDFSLLGLVLFHGLNGIRNILLEWEPLNRRRQGLTIGLCILGGVTFIYGAWALLLFIFAG